MKRTSVAIIPYLMFLGFVSSLSFDLHPALAKESLAPLHRALSLRVLQAQAQACHAQQGCSDAVQHLGYMTRIDGYVIDADEHDIILYGQVDSSKPPLYLEDFVVALRDAWKMYAIKKGNTYYYSDPGVTIDPHEKVMAKLEEIGAWLNQANKVQIPEGLEAWHQVCHMPQQVRVLGMPFHTRFSKVLVDADYFMKKLVDGSESLPTTTGFPSLVELYVQEAKVALRAGASAQIPLGSMSRFWFYPQLFCPGTLLCEESEKVTVLHQVDDGVLLMKQFGIMLRTEEEYLNTKGKIVGRGNPDRLAQTWAQLFTEYYPQIAQIHPMYQDLENLGRWIALVRAMKFRSIFQEAGLDLQWLFSDYQVPETHVEETVPGHSNVKTIEHREAVEGGYSIATLTLPSCGGVEFAIHLTHKNFVDDQRGILLAMKQQALGSRPANETLFWNF